MPASSLPSKFAFLDPPIESEDLGSLGPYRVIGELGRGGMGFVFRAEDTRLKRVVALKVMNQKIAATADSRQRFIDEARAMAAVKHDNVATIYEVSDQSSTPFMAMELLAGKTLEQVLRRDKRLPYQRVIEYAKQICRGLSAAHARGIVHRDIKPANIWIDEELNRIKILDFGLALANSAVDQLTGRGSVVGTPQYLAPEQASSEPLDDRSDLFSLGIVLFELTTGQLPFRARTVADQLIATLALTPPKASELCPEVPEPLSELIARLMQKEPRKRPRSARELEMELESVAKECEAKSDVALTINKLQESLLQVASKKEAPPVSPAPAAASSNLNPFDFPAPATPLAAPLANVTAAGPVPVNASVSNSAVRPVSTFGTPVVGSTNAKQAVDSKAEFNWVRLWPLAVIGGVAVVLLAIVGGVWYGTLSATQQVANNTLVMPPAPAATNSPPAPMPSSVTNTPPPKKSEPNSAKSTRSPASKVPNDSAPKQGSTAQPADAVATADKATDLDHSRVDVDATAESALSMREQPENSTASADSEPSLIESDNSIAAANGSSNDDNLDDDQNKIASEANEAVASDKSLQDPVMSNTLELSTNEGSGADTTVKRGGSSQDSLGEDKVLAIQHRTTGNKTIDIQHVYLRFDLKDRVDRAKKVLGCSLVLTATSSSVPADAVIRVYGVPEKYPDNWRESGTGMITWNNSLSREDLADAPLVAETPLTLNDRNQVVLQDPRMAEFVDGLDKDEVVTFILTGGSSEGRPIYFVSREGASEAVPQLKLEVAEVK